MRNRISLIIVLLASIVSGFESMEPGITENEAETIVENHHANQFGTVELLSIKHQHNQYVVKWENAGNCEWGTDKVDDEGGEIEMVEAAIC